MSSSKVKFYGLFPLFNMFLQVLRLHIHKIEHFSSLFKQGSTNQYMPYGKIIDLATGSRETG